MKDRTRLIAAEKNSLPRRIWESRFLYLLMLPGMLYFVIFKYIPMDGLLLAMKKYNARLGIWGSPWVGFSNFERIFITPDAVNALINTVTISLSRLVIEFPIPILLALLLNEMRGKVGKRILQTVYTFPHFLSWVVVSLIIINFFSNSGGLNSAIASFGGQRVNFLADKRLFRPLLYFTSAWKEAGWSAIIYMAAIAGIDQTLYEAACVDGATRFQQTWHVTLPGIRNTILVLFILAVGRVMNAGFDQIFNIQNDAVKAVSQIIDTYVYEITFEAAPNYGFSAAVEVFKSIINLALLLIANRIARVLTGNGLFA